MARVTIARRAITGEETKKAEKADNVQGSGVAKSKNKVEI
jgi:hypothetical protein